jgi:hypothetical protein
MGMYTELCLAVELKADTPKDLIAALHYMAGNTDDQPTPLPEHEFFKCQRWPVLFSCDSCYFASESYSSFRFEDVSDTYRLTFRANLKNYDQEQEKFLNLIQPWLETEDEFVGYQRYEEEDHPTLIYIDEGRKFVMRAVK